MGYPDGDSAMTGLMSAIYHRLTFLDLEADQLGRRSGRAFARLSCQGRSGIAGLCQTSPAEALYRTPVDCLGTAMTRDHYEGLCADCRPTPCFVRHTRCLPERSAAGRRLHGGALRATAARAAFDGHGRYFVPCENVHGLMPPGSRRSVR